MGTLVAGGIGTAMGILSGYVGRWVAQIIMRVTDAWLALPALVFAIFLAAMVGPSMWNIVAILGGVYWTRYARVIRGEVLTLREREFVKLAEIAGASRWRVIKRHILPNVMNTTTGLSYVKKKETPLSSHSGYDAYVGDPELCLYILIFMPT